MATETVEVVVVDVGVGVVGVNVLVSCLLSLLILYLTYKFSVNCLVECKLQPQATHSKIDKLAIIPQTIT